MEVPDLAIDVPETLLFGTELSDAVITAFEGKVGSLQRLS